MRTREGGEAERWAVRAVGRKPSPSLWPTSKRPKGPRSVPPARYVSTALNHYRQEGGARRDPAMVSVAKGLRDADISAVAAFVASLN